MSDHEPVPGPPPPDAPPTMSSLPPVPRPPAPPMAPPTPPRMTDQPAPSPAAPLPEPERITVPSIDHSLHPSVQWYWRIPLLIISGIAAIALLLVGFGLGEPIFWAIAAVTIAALLTTAFVVPSRRYASWRWRLTAQACEAEHGVLWHQVRVLPYFRIQHIDIEHGPIDRMFGMASLRIHTASVTTTLPGLLDATATILRTQLLELADVETAAARSDARDAV